MFVYAHHTVEIAYVLIISVWWNTGEPNEEWTHIGNQIQLNQPMTLEQCEYLLNEDMWGGTRLNPYYKFVIHCVPDE